MQQVIYPRDQYVSEMLHQPCILEYPHYLCTRCCSWEGLLYRIMEKQELTTALLKDKHNNYLEDQIVQDEPLGGQD